jgi:hypothetical protein
MVKRLCIKVLGVWSIKIEWRELKEEEKSETQQVDARAHRGVVRRIGPAERESVYERRATAA